MKQKIFSIIISIFSIFVLAACTDNSFMGKTYNITYVVDSKIVELEPSTYVAGEGAVLPSAEGLNEGRFIGWYDNASFEGVMTSKINAYTYGDKVFYAYFEEAEEVLDLNKALSNLSSYSYIFLYTCEEADDSYICSYEYSNNILKSVYDNGIYGIITEYLATTNGELYYYGEYDDGSYYVLDENDEEFLECLSYFDILDFSVIDVSDFEYVDGYFQLKDQTKINTITTSFMGASDGERFTDFKIKVSNDQIVEILAKSIYTYYGEDYTYDFIISISNHGSVNVTLPDVNNQEDLASLSVNLTSVRVEKGTSLLEIIKDLQVTYFDGTTNQTLTSEQYVLTHDYNGDVAGTYVIKVGYQNLSATFTIYVTGEGSEPFKPEEGSIDLLEDVIDYMGEQNGVVYGVARGLPSTGNSKMLVIPVAFTNHTVPSNVVSNLEKVFFGTSEETGWESLTSYYYKASYHKLNITGSVLPVFQTGKTSNYYEKLEDSDYEIIQAALTYYDSTIDYSEYDSDSDGYIDSIVLVYTCPIERNDDNSMWWAYTYEYYTDDVEYYDGVEADFYILAGYDFIFEELASSKKVIYNAETFIHETGHLLGLTDYYDYDETAGPSGGIGGGDMMDYNVGDHNAFSKVILGWTTPMIMNNQSATVTLKSFGETGDCLIIPKKWNGSYFDEYYIIDFYTPNGLNSIEAGYSGLFSTSGIRIYHIDATLKNATDCFSVWDVYKYDNSYTDHRLITLIEADMQNDIDNNKYSENSDLFQAGMSYTSFTWYDGTKANFTLEVINISENEAIIQINYK